MDIKNVAQQGKQLTPEQQQALARLHDAATKFEGVFVGMLLQEMRKTAPTTGIFGQESASEQTFSEMLDQQRATQIANSGSLGVARILEQQLRQTVLADAPAEAKSRRVEGEF
ncbi:MAG: rod-binding protein [bacterium]|nr:rod-binding protein [bacterium]